MMERRPEVPEAESSPRGAAASVPSPANTTPVTPTHVVMETPEVASEEVVLNRRGMPARQRKRNRFYFDDNNIVTDDNIYKSLTKTALKKVKEEPVDTYDNCGELDDSFPPFVQEEVQIQSSPRESNSSYSKLPLMAVNTVMQKVNKIAHREQHMSGKSNSEQQSRNKRIDVETTPGKHGAGAQRGTPRSNPVSNKKIAIKHQTPQPKQIKIEKTVARGENTPKMKYSGAATASSRKNTKSGTNVFVTPAGKGPGKGKHDLSSGNRHNMSDSASRGRLAKSTESQFGDALYLMEDTGVNRTQPPVRIKKELDTSQCFSSQAHREKLIADRQVGQYNKMVKYDRNASETEKDRMVRVGEKKTYKERVRKEQDRDLVPTTSKSGGPKRSPLENEEKHTMYRKTAHDISLRLRNLLKLPKAHKWVCYEWFYSNIDKVLFEEENDFQLCLKDAFPQLKTRKLTRVEWCKIRRLMGKPRRCSRAFFDEERRELARRRQKIRLIQQRKPTDFSYKELPDEIPLHMVIGTKVTARLRRPQDGLFTGTIEGLDTSNNTYRITFDRGGLGTHSIPDFEVLSNVAPETVSTSSFALKIARRSFEGMGGFKLQNASLLCEDGNFAGLPKSLFPVNGMLGGFPIRLLDMIVRLTKLLKAKREKILQLKELNTEAEKLRSYSKAFNGDFRLRYARCVLDLGSLNKEMSMYLNGIQQFCLQIAPDHGGSQMIVPEVVQSQCKQEANLIVDTYNTKQNRNLVQNPNSIALISNLTSLMLQVKSLSIGDRTLYDLKSIKDSIKQIKASLVGNNVQQFQDGIEIPMNRIQAGLCVSGPSKNY